MPSTERASVHPRVHAADAAIAEYGDLATRCFAALDRCDPIADALVTWLRQTPTTSSVGQFDLHAAWRAWSRGEPQPAPVAALFEDLALDLGRVDWRRIDRARRLFERTGPFGGFVLSLRSLMAGYTAPAGNKPLVFSGRLQAQTHRRVAETARFVTAVCAPDGMRPGAEGWMIAVHVRLMHAQVRRLLWDSGRWDDGRWAAPINQHDMLATMLLFSEVYVEGLRIFGFSIAAEEAEDWVYLWSWVSWVMGTERELLPRDYAEATATRELIDATQGPPDADSRALAAALLEPPPQLTIGPRMAAVRHGMVRGLTRMLIGEPVADSLSIAPAPIWSRVLPAVPRIVSTGERVRERVPALERSIRAYGAEYWAWVVEQSLAGQPARFTRPDTLRA